MTKRRVVVTGLGMLSPIGNDVPTAWANAVAGKSGANRIDDFDVTDYGVQICAAVKDFEATDYFDRKEARRLDSFIQYGMAAGIQAVADAGLDSNPADATRIGVAIGGTRFL